MPKAILLADLGPTFALIMRGFPRHARRVMAALAKARGPATARQVAEASGLGVNHASAVLGRLCAADWVASVPLDGKRNVYEIAGNHRWFKVWLCDWAGPADMAL